VLCGVLVANAAGTGSTAREALLKEARTRLTTWYQDKKSLNLPYWSGNANVLLTKDDYWCDAKGGSARMPVTFGEFNVSDASPRDVFSVLTDVTRTHEWDATLRRVARLGDFQDEEVRGINVEVNSGIIFVPARELYEWMAYNTSLEDQEYWIAFSSLENERLHAVRERDGAAVAMQNCLGGYWIRPCPAGGEPPSSCPAASPVDCCPDGGSHVVFTQHVNVHAGFLSPRLMFDASWYRQIDWVNTVRTQAKRVKENGEARLDMPPWLLQGAPTPGPGSEAKQGALGPAISCMFPPPPGSPAVSQLYELPGTSRERGLTQPAAQCIGPALAVLAALAAVTALIRPLGLRRPQAAVCARSRASGRAAAAEEEGQEDIDRASSQASLLRA